MNKNLEILKEFDIWFVRTYYGMIEYQQKYMMRFNQI